MPVGFMAHLDHGQFKLVMCSGGFAKIVDATVDNIGDHHSGTHNDDELHASICMFAFSAGAALGNSGIVRLAEQSLNATYGTFYYAQYFIAHPASIYRVRGPPIFS